MVRAKVYALVLGTYGLGIVSQIVYFSGLVCFIGTFGLPLGLIKYVSEWEKNNEWDKISNVISSFVTMLFAIGVVFAAVIIIFSSAISGAFLDNSHFGILIILTAISFPFSFSTLIIESFLKGIKKFKMYVFVTASISILSVILTVLLVISNELYGAVAALMVNSVFSFVFYLIFVKRKKLIKLKIGIKFNISHETKLVFAIGIASLLVGIVEQSTQLSIRTVIVKILGANLNGIYQSVASISNNYLNLFFISISTYSLPILSEMSTQENMNDELNSIFRFAILFIVPIITLTFVFRNILVLVLYSHSFTPGTDLMLYNFTGDFFKALTWVFGAWLIPAARIKLWASIAIIYYLLYFVAFYFMIQSGFNLYSVVLAYLITNFVICFISFYYLRKLNNFRFKKINLFSLVFSVIYLLMVMVLSEANVILGYVIIVPLTFIWLKLSVKNDEIKKLISLITSKIIKPVTNQD